MIISNVLIHIFYNSQWSSQPSNHLLSFNKVDVHLEGNRFQPIETPRLKAKKDLLTKQASLLNLPFHFLQILGLWNESQCIPALTSPCGQQSQWERQGRPCPQLACQPCLNSFLIDRLKSQSNFKPRPFGKSFQLNVKLSKHPLPKWQSSCIVFFQMNMWDDKSFLYDLISDTKRETIFHMTSHDFILITINFVESQSQTFFFRNSTCTQNIKQTFLTSN